MSISGSNTSSNIVAGNYIGVDVSGAVAMSSELNGVSVFGGAQSNRIGTDGDGKNDALEANVIASNENVSNNESTKRRSAADDTMTSCIEATRRIG